jgi:hypothetical protein
MAAEKAALKKINITKSVCHPPYNLAYSPGELAEVAPDMYDLLLKDGRGTAVTEKPEAKA